MTSERDPVERVLDFALAVPTTALVAARRTIPLVGYVAIGGISVVTSRAGRRARPPRHTRGYASPVPRYTVAASDDASAPDITAAVRTEPPVADPPVAATPDIVELPIEDYVNLAARQVVEQLATLTPDQLLVIETYERSHRHRQTILGRIGQLRS